MVYERVSAAHKEKHTANVSHFLKKTICSMACKLGVTIVAKNDYCDSIDIAGSTIAILLVLLTTIAILL